MFPTQSLPRPLELITRLVPLRYAIDGMRGALLEGQSPLAMARTLAILAAFGLILLPLALFALSISLRRARQNGTLSYY
jgi:ABC-2 type transport system permease protein